MSTEASAARAKRHDELWRGSSRSLGRLFVGTLVFGAIVLLRVFGPYTDNLEKLAWAQDKEAAAQARLDSVEERLAWATGAADEVTRVSRKIDGEPWEQGAVALQISLAELVDDAEALRQTSQDRVKEVRLAPQTAQLHGADLARQLPPTERARQVPPGLDERRRERRPPREADGPTDERRVVEAADRLRIGEQDLTHPRDPQQWRTFVDDRLRVAARDDARASIAAMRTATEEDVIEPLRRVVDEGGPELTGSAALRANLEELDRSLDQWDSRYGEREDWYQTVEGKGEAFRALGDELTRYRVACREVTDDLLSGLNAEKAAVDAERNDIQSEVSDIETQIDETETALQEALPSWLRGLVTIDNAIQLFPAVVLAILLLGAWYAVRTRRHYLIVRKELWAAGVDATEPAMSTVWTLVYRRATGTAVTIAAYALALALAWYLVSEAVDQHGLWHDQRPEGAVIIGSAEVATASAAWLGPLLCAAALAAALVVLFRDYRVVLSLGRAASPS